MRIGGHDLSKRVLVVAEIGNNHEGDPALAREMVRAAAAAGADAVKFQAIVPERLVAATEVARLEQLRRITLPFDRFPELAETAAENRVMFLCTPFDPEGVRFLAPLVPAMKIASGDNDCRPLIEAAAATGKPILLSTGMLDADGFKTARRWVEAVWDGVGAGGGIIPLHCVSSYPTSPTEANLGALREMAAWSPVIGYSDHTLGIEAAVLSTAMGARVVEKHFTLDRGLSGFRDHQLSADPAEFREMVRRIREAEVLVGDGVKAPTSGEAASLSAARRGGYAARDLPVGRRLEPGDVVWLRPRRAGNSPAELESLYGRALVRPAGVGAPLVFDLFE